MQRNSNARYGNVRYDYERRKENTNLALNKIKRNESDLRSDRVGVQQDARTQEGKSRQVFEWKGFVDSRDPRSQLGKTEVEALRREAISELESRKDVPVLMLERVRFSVIGAPVPSLGLHIYYTRKHPQKNLVNTIHPTNLQLFSLYPLNSYI